MLTTSSQWRAACLEAARAKYQQMQTEYVSYDTFLDWLRDDFLNVVEIVSGPGQYDITAGTLSIDAPVDARCFNVICTTSIANVEALARYFPELVFHIEDLQVNGILPVSIPSALFVTTQLHWLCSDSLQLHTQADPETAQEMVQLANAILQKYAPAYNYSLFQQLIASGVLEREPEAVWAWLSTGATTAVALPDLTLDGMA